MARWNRLAESIYKLEILWDLMLLKGARPFEVKLYLISTSPLRGWLRQNPEMDATNCADTRLCMALDARRIALSTCARD